MKSPAADKGRQRFSFGANKETTASSACSLSPDILLFAAVGLVGDRALQSAAFQQRKKNLIAEIVSGTDIAEGLHFSSGSCFDTILQQSIVLCDIKFYRNYGIINLTTWPPDLTTRSRTCPLVTGVTSGPTFVMEPKESGMMILNTSPSMNSGTAPLYIMVYL